MKLEKLNQYLAKFKAGPEIEIINKPKLNKVLFGLEKKKLYVVGARPSQGKSLFCLGLAYDISIKHKVLFLSLEMNEEEAMFRLLCRHSRISNTQLREMPVEDFLDEHMSFCVDIKRRRLIVCEEMGRTLEELEDVVNKRLALNKPDVIVIDYIQCIKSNKNKMEAIDNYVRELRAIAIRENICIILCSQISRANIVDNNIPTMEGLKNTGTLEEQADAVLILHYPYKQNKVDSTVSINDFIIYVSKNKNGPTGYVKYKILPSIYMLEEKGEEQTDEEQTEVKWDE